MSSFFLTFLAVAMAMFAGREAVRVARLAASGAKTAALFTIAVAAAGLACAIATWLAGTFGDLLTEQQKAWFVAAALGVAALEVLLLHPPRAAQEPTQSLGAIAIVVFAGVLADASGLLVLSLSVWSGKALLAAAGGGMAAAIVFALAILAGEDWENLPRHILRPAIAGILTITASVIVFIA